MKINKALILIIYIFELYRMIPTATFADGGFFYNYSTEVEKLGNSAESPNQRALIIHNGEKETMLLQVKYSGNVENFAWVVPVPLLPEENSIKTESDSIFTELHDQTQPRLYKIKRRSSSYLSEGGKSNGLGDNQEVIVDMAVQVWNKLQVGPYEIALLSGTSSQALIDWLTTNGYQFPDEAQLIVDYYIQKNWYFMATRVEIQSTLQKSNSTYQAGLPALQMTFKTEKPVFPLRISELTAAKESEIELYVATDHRMICDGYQTAQISSNDVQNWMAQNQKTNNGVSCNCKNILWPEYESVDIDYEAIFRQKVTSYQQPTFVVEYAEDYYIYSWKDPYDNNLTGYFRTYFNPETSDETRFWLTRFRTILPPGSMKEDVSFVPDPNGDNPYHLEIRIEEKNLNLMIFLKWPGIFLLPFFLLKKIRKRYWRELMLTILLTFIAIG